MFLLCFAVFGFVLVCFWYVLLCFVMFCYVLLVLASWDLLGLARGDLGPSSGGLGAVLARS